MSTSTDRIERSILLRVPRSRVWRALTDPVEFGTWFGVKVDGVFAPGARVRGAVTHKGYEHLTWDITIERMEPPRLFSWRWHPPSSRASTIRPSLRHSWCLSSRR
jgi:uncharacterized protein YndB with AHSA1/START domain